MPSPLFNKILKKNQLLRGRLNSNEADLDKLYQVLQKDADKLVRKQMRQEEIIKSAVAKRNEIKLQIKRISESIQKSFHPSSDKISLLYKKMGGAFYIKARFYWEGKQREVQVGSITIVLKLINTMISNNLLPDMKPIKAKKLTWKEIKKRPLLINCIKQIASYKSQEYILRKLMYEKLSILESNDIPENEENETSKLVKEDPQNPANYKSNKVEASEMEDVDNWYDKWRKDNL